MIANNIFLPLPLPSQERLHASLGDQPFDIDQFTASQGPVPRHKDTTILYLAYGSNMCNETFRGVRGIRPLSQINVVVPSLRLTFDLPGIPYSEPCFANTTRRLADAQSDDKVYDVAVGRSAVGYGYHKDRWHKGLVGVVYEVTRSDYAHIIATEGGGSAYSDILVDCFSLPAGDMVPTLPTTRPFKAHTLFAPLPDDERKQPTDRVSRPDSSYAQPSARYLRLIIDGAAECHLSKEYQDYLHSIRSYTITTRRQAMGKALFLATWLPLVMLIFSLARLVQDEKGRAPSWFAKISAWVFLGMWASYDKGFKRLFGDGERTIDQLDNHDHTRTY